MPFIKKIYPNLLLIPMMTHWILPASIEHNLYVNLAEIKFYLFNICYLLYIFLYSASSHNLSRYYLRFRNRIVGCCILIFCFALLHCTLSSIPYSFAAIFNNLNYCYLAILFLAFPLSEDKVKYTKWPVLLSLIIITGEVILYGLGILTYQGINDEDTAALGGTFGRIMRISTTVGAATGTGIIIMFLGGLALTLYSMTSFQKWCVLIISSFGVFFTVSRGASLSWTLLIMYYIYTRYLRHRRLGFKLRSLIGITCIGIGLFYAGLFNPLIERYSLKSDVDVSSGRDIRVETAINYYYNSGYMGVGLAQVYCDKSISDIMPNTYKVAPHNTYVTILAEQGIIGFLLFCSLLVIILRSLDYKNHLSVLIWLTILINMNTEAVLLHAEFMAPFLFITMVSIKKQV